MEKQYTKAKSFCTEAVEKRTQVKLCHSATHFRGKSKKKCKFFYSRRIHFKLPLKFEMKFDRHLQSSSVSKILAFN